MRQIAETRARHIIRMCTKRGLLDDTAADPLADEEPVLPALTAASVRGLIATGARVGQRLRCALRDPAIGVRTASLCFASSGFSLHAATRVVGPDRQEFERLCRYVARPALASGLLHIRDSLPAPRAVRRNAPSSTKLPPETLRNPLQRCSEHSGTIRCDDQRAIRDPIGPLTTVSANGIVPISVPYFSYSAPRSAVRLVAESAPGKVPTRHIPYRVLSACR